MLAIARGVVAWLALQAATKTQTFDGKVVGVTDGDTITVLNGTTPIKVRL